MDIRNEPDNRITGSPSLSCFCLLATGEGVSSTECHYSYGLCISTCARVSGLGNFAQTSSEYAFAKFDTLKSNMTSVHIGPRDKISPVSRNRIYFVTGSVR